MRKMIEEGYWIRCGWHFDGYELESVLRNLWRAL